MGLSHIRLYVRSLKTVTGTVEEMRLPPSLNTRVRLRPDLVTEPKFEYVLPEDQERIREIVKEAASKFSLEVEVIDVSRENILHRAIQEQREKIKAFPALVTDAGERIEGNITEEQAQSFLSRIADRTRKKYL